MKPYYKNGTSTIYHGDCLDVLPSLQADAIVTDPPYGLKFMGKNWDHGVPGVAYWEAALTAIKPGAHLLAFGGTRKIHRLTCAIEDAGFEIRDCVMWVYGSGFPKSLDVGKAIDKAAGTERKVLGPGRRHNSQRCAVAHGDTKRLGGGIPNITIPATDAAKQWEGWGTALKPAWEPIIVARKPLEGTVAENVLKYGTGALNIDGCRVTHEEESKMMRAQTNREVMTGHGKIRQGGRHKPVLELKPEGRWPANLIHDGSEEVLELFPQTAGKVGMTQHGSATNQIYGTFKRTEQSFVNDGIRDSGSAARFFYCAKASGNDRGNETLQALPLFDMPEETFANDHPTVKPVELMKYLIRLVVPPGGVVLDPFMGSGSTLVAAREHECNAIGIELAEEYCSIAVERLERKK